MGLFGALRGAERRTAPVWGHDAWRVVVWAVRAQRGAGLSTGRAAWVDWGSGLGTRGWGCSALREPLRGFLGWFEGGLGWSGVGDGLYGALRADLAGGGVGGRRSVVIRSSGVSQSTSSAAW